jgi:hypothetical protein
MKVLSYAMTVCAVILVCASFAHAGVFEFTPSPADLSDLDHNYYYSWGIRWTPPAGEIVTDAVLTIKSINDWANEPNDVLNIHLLDNPTVGVRSYYDNEGNGDAYASWPLIGRYTDTNGSASENLSFAFTQPVLDSLNSYLANGVFGAGFDPDCHYYNCGIKLTLTTRTPSTPGVPEPGGLLAIASGMISLVGVIRRRTS